ncbi:hypothetical protein LIX60_13540 [Streptomyces sp. S07_1.15]|uniref:hypothetical protein n=1 Tax=Streptomyces sp. S07_1.15 TaxID=2873925 RepID=UPI001D1384F9|nr:hypothetical protein [Streptomyces sp. S07_1.15]MCC3652475.1 hypothetical protein [Streptomyces sp. S07_1.15]
MGSLRNPVGPLPSSIYWRRRAVALCVVALLAVLVVWAVRSTGGGGGDGGGGADGKGPAQSITPGPSSSGPAISERPGGRDDSGGTGGGDGGGDSGGTGGSAGSGGGSGGDAGSGGSGGGGGAAGGGSGSGGSGGGSGIPAGTALPDCGAEDVELRIRTVENRYEPGEKPEFELTAESTSNRSCEVDFGEKTAVLTITPADEDDPLWASDDCLKESREIRLRVPAGGEAMYTVEWDRRPSAPKCATPGAGSAKAGTYLIEAEAKGVDKAEVSFVLTKD